MKSGLIVLACILLFSACHENKQEVHAPSPTVLKDTPFQLGVIDSIQSTVLGEKRILNIYLPDDFDRDSIAFKKYPVIYLLDGSKDEDFIHTAGIVQFMNMMGRAPRVILVGIANVDRKRDFTFPTTIEQDRIDFPTTGKSEPFMAFLKQELKPWIEQKYGGTMHTTLIGQSLGGLLASEILFKDPCMFDDYLIVSPSLWWDNQSLFQYADGVRKNTSCYDRCVYLTVGTEGEEMEKPAERLAAMLDSIPDERLKVKFFPLKEEDHLTILHNAIYSMMEIRYETEYK